MTDPEVPEQVVDPQSQRVRPSNGLVDHTTLSEQRDHEIQRLDQVRRSAQQGLALREAFEHEADLVLLEIAESPMDELGRRRRGPRTEVPFVDQRGTQSTGLSLIHISEPTRR